MLWWNPRGSRVRLGEHALSSALFAIFDDAINKPFVDAGWAAVRVKPVGGAGRLPAEGDHCLDGRPKRFLFVMKDTIGYHPSPTSARGEVS
mgnify:CR=1 FL=1